jgi:hypothetical protein
MTGFMEASLAQGPPKGHWTQVELRQAAEAAQIQTFGWPIGIVIDRPEFRPRPTAEGVVAEIAIEASPLERPTYDYWSLRRNGDFYLLQTLFEDQIASTPSIYFNTRIVRVTEVLLYASRLYSRLGVAPTTDIHVRIGHGGLRGRVLGATANRASLFPQRQTQEEEVSSEASFTVDRLDTEIVSVVQQLLDPLFMVFDFFQPAPSLYEQIVNDFVEGRVT